MNHCSERRGSTTVPQRSHLPMREGVVFFGDEKSLLLQIGEHALAGFVSVEPGICARVLVHVGVLVHDVDLRQVVALAGFEIVGIVRGRYLYCAGTELGLREFVDDDGNLAIHQRQQNFLAVQMRVALVFFVDGNGGIAEHGLRARGRHGYEFVA